MCCGCNCSGYDKENIEIKSIDEDGYLLVKDSLAFTLKNEGDVTVYLDENYPIEPGESFPYCSNTGKPLSENKRIEFDNSGTGEQKLILIKTLGIKEEC